MKDKISKKKTVVVGMSGGVDSSVTAALLKYGGFSAKGGPASGWNVIGVYMKNWSQDVGDYGCTWAQDSEDARKVAQVLKIPFYVWNFEKEYYKKVVEYFFREYKAGRTPNPDVMCNTEIKFKVFLEKALALGADYVATGHYARIKETENRKQETEYHLLKGVDPTKDQSYFLYSLKQKQLAKILFPIGDLPKSEVRKLAKKFKLPNAEKKDSQGICFIGNINVTEFLKAHISANKGKIVTTKGEVLGRHDGLPYYTIGQREGIGVGGGDGPYYVVDKNIKKNQLIVTNNKNDKMLWRKSFELTDLTWVNQAPKMPFTTGVSIRYHHPACRAFIKKTGNRKQETGKVLVTFKELQRAITVGQSAVIYKGHELLGGGVIQKVL